MIALRVVFASVLTTSMIGSALTAAAGEPTGTLAGRTELHAISTLTLSDAQFLAGDANATPTTVTGQLRVAQGGPADGRLPVVVLMHGSGGMGPNIEMWAEELNAMGVSSFALDGFTGRGLTQVSTDQAKLGRLNFILDIYRSLDLLAKHPRVDPTRIALMGFSRGGQAALYASLKRFHKTWNKSGVEFAAYLPFYPDCATTFVGDTDVADRPIRIFGGTPDDYNPIALCKPYVERLRAAGRDVLLTEYPNAPHGFDNPLGAQPAAAVANAQSVRHCQVREEPQGLLINAVSRQPFNYNDPCVERGAHVGGDPAAAVAAKSAVKGVLATAFKLD
jgi:dienelactone hydrolase